MFQEFPKIARLSREIVVTEKIDGTNAQVFIQPLGDPLPVDDVSPDAVSVIYHEDAGATYAVFAGSRTRWVKPGKANDNHGFAGWVCDHAEELVIGLGEGRHYGEWWGHGINRGYGLKEKRFSLFNVHRWENPDARPACCHVVPTLYRGPFVTTYIETHLLLLRCRGSYAAPGFMNPEGIVVFHAAGNLMFKKTLERDDAPKSMATSEEATP